MEKRADEKYRAFTVNIQLELKARKKKTKSITVSKNHTFSAQAAFIWSVKHRLTSALRRAGFTAEVIEHSGFSYTVGVKAWCQNVCQTPSASCALNGQYNSQRAMALYSHVRLLHLFEWPSLHYVQL